MATLKRCALGQRVHIGALYDSRTDQFLPDYLFKPNLPEAATPITTQQKADVTVKYGDTYRERIDLLGLSTNLAGSVLAGAVRFGGASRYLAEQQGTRFVHAALQHVLITSTQTLDFHFPGLQNHLTSTTAPNVNATHLVMGIEWGSKSIISVRGHTGPGDRVSIDQQLQTDFAAFASAVQTLSLAERGRGAEAPRVDLALTAEITAYSEMFDEQDGVLLRDLNEALEFLQMVPLHIKTTDQGRGWPVMYALMPLEVLGYLLPMQVPRVLPTFELAPDVLNSCFRLLDDYSACERKLDGCMSVLLANAEYLSPTRQLALEHRIRAVQKARKIFKEEFACTHSSVKSGSQDPGGLRALLDRYLHGDLSPQRIQAFDMPNEDTLAFVQKAVYHGAVHLGHAGMTIEDVLSANPQSDAYIMYLRTPATGDDTANFDLLLELLRDGSADTVVMLADGEPNASDRTRIAQLQHGSEKIPDLLECRKVMAGKCLVKCEQRSFETENIKPPIQRRYVYIACPGTRCSVAKVHEWLCSRCMVPIEYGYTDRYIYCDCGKSLYSNYVFRCNGDTHGPDFTPHGPQQLLHLLDALVQTHYLNILILGETGVGKSTFINAMVNYLEFETLDEAMAAEKLNFVIPCAFATQIMDRSKPDRPIEEKIIKIGASGDERDGTKGDSATQKTTVYPVTFKAGETTGTVRLIDTPGIGDSRGVDADRQNMADILSTLSGYDKIHGILILLKSNNARLTITFRYCIKELLTHLHHNAAANMAFGFTNTRISNYTPGDTYGPLKALLSQHPNEGLQLVTPTTYCFDSESFRFLAAYKNDVLLPNKVDFDRSWGHSRQETIRLMQHFQAMPPHKVKSTISLNGARELISELTKPIAEISQLINTNIRVVEDEVKALKDHRLKGDELRNMLHVQKVQMNAEQLPMPRTVCGDKACTEVRDDGKGQNTMVIIYKQHCHPVCYLDDVQADVMAHPGLIQCAAFDGRQSCGNCGHHWQQHLHILYELREETVTVIDHGIQQQLANHVDDITLKQAAIRQKEELVSEYRQERDFIRDVAAKFCVFLKNNSLAPYNDALIAYLDFLIKEEQAKVQAGGNNRRLESLTLERHKHQEAIKIITRDMDTNPAANDLREGGVDRMVQALYNLNHFGNNLRALRQGIATAHQATYREKPHMVKRMVQPTGTAMRVLSRPPVNKPSDENPGRLPNRPDGTLSSIGGALAAKVKKHLNIT